VGYLGNRHAPSSPLCAPISDLMYLSHLSLTHFRNYQHLELDLQGRFTLLQGQNAQGKTNLLEAIFFLATSKPVHAQTEREVVDWRAGDEPIPYSRIAGRLHNDGGSAELEIILTPRGDGLNFAKQVKINGVNRRSVDLIGLLRTVLFLPEDIKLVDGAPGERRRYLDIALCQLDRTYFRTLAAYQKVLTQRNSLLRSLSEQAAPASESIESQLDFWDEKLVEHGSYVITRRQQFTEQLNQAAQQRHAALSDGRERLQLHYLPSFNPGHLSEFDYAALTDERLILWPELTPGPLDQATVNTHYRNRLRQRRRRELAAGVTLYGPHRDDLRFVANGRDLRSFGSRGQQRTAALALKLAEVQVSTEITGVAPVLLLDDVMSELDAGRRQTLLSALEGVQQAIITTTDWEDFAPAFRAQAQRLHVDNGAIQAAADG
jgi:DNA replication and repair protein RecF